MMTSVTTKKNVLNLPVLVLTAILFLLPGCSGERQLEIVDVNPLENIDFKQFDDRSRKLDFNTLGNTLCKTRGLYTMIFYGDYSDVLKVQHNRLKMMLPLQNKTDVSCSMYAAYDTTTPMCGRNFDNIDTDLLVVFCFPPGGYRSIGFTPLRFLNYKKNTDLTQLHGIERAALIYSPFFISGGFNEKGIAVGLHAMAKKNFSPDRQKQYCLYMPVTRLRHRLQTFIPGFFLDSGPTNK